MQYIAGLVAQLKIFNQKFVHTQTIPFVVIVSYSVCLFYYLVNITPHPMGMDGYYYLLQHRAIIETGELYVNDAPITFLIVALLSFLFSPVIAVKLVSILALAACLYFCSRIIFELTHNAWWSLLAVLLISTSPNIEFYLTEFIKNGLGLAIVAWVILKTLQFNREKSKGTLGLIALLILCLWLTHKAAFGLALGYLISWSLINFTLRKSPVHLLTIFYLSLFLVGSLIGYGTLGIDDFISQSQPTILNASSDLWPFGYLIEGYFSLIAIVVGLLVLALTWSHITRSELCLLLPSIVYCLVTVVIWWGESLNPEGVKARLYLMTMIPTSFVITLGLSIIPRIQLAVVLALMLVAAKLMLISQTQFPLKQYTSPEKAVNELITSIEKYIPRDAVIIFSERFFVYRIAYETRRATRLCRYENDDRQYWRVDLAKKEGRLQSNQIDYSEYFSYMPMDVWLANVPKENDYCRR
ncbi:hypothetical protein FLL45_18565 [Aliikangiella marina]|uniref:Glycosyltransferase RgtA/B/C/D-like domain-containing protein n=1 Tax=Aliikangiella marina TaxID=1712262 RepID=A0A545T4T5_9GAMM|nr:hypothetical protein [Aliikangiella marina]TQV72223.1 hypothetical protein FLL45_18565 [Aliikangiella marina]